MWVRVDLTELPPVVALEEPDDFQDFKVVVGSCEHCFVRLGLVKALAGERADDPEWRRRFDAMIAYAREHGWIGDDGAIRAHIEAP
jgi:hypothetical protein